MKEKSFFKSIFEKKSFEQASLDCRKSFKKLKEALKESLKKDYIKLLVLYLTIYFIGLTIFFITEK